MEDTLCFVFYTMLCCSLCCPPLQQPLSSRGPNASDVVIDNPTSTSVNGDDKPFSDNPLKNQSELKKDGPAV